MNIESLFVKSIVRQRPVRLLRQIVYYAVVLSVLTLLLATAVLPGLNQAMYLLGAPYDGKAIVDDAQDGTVIISQDNMVVNGRVEAGVLLAERNVPCLLCFPNDAFEYETSDFSDESVMEGKPPRVLESDEIALSVSLAKSLDVSLGDEIFMLNMAPDGNGDYYSYKVASILSCHYSSSSEAALGGAGIAFIKPSAVAEALATDSEQAVYYRGAPPVGANVIVSKSDEIDRALGFLGNGVAYGTVVALAGILLIMIAGRELSCMLAEHGRSIAVLCSCGTLPRRMVGSLAAKEFAVLILSGTIALVAVKLIVESSLVSLLFPWRQALLFIVVVACIEAVVIVIHMRHMFATIKKVDMCALLARGVGDE